MSDFDEYESERRYQAAVRSAELKILGNKLLDALRSGNTSEASRLESELYEKADPREHDLLREIEDVVDQCKRVIRKTDKAYKEIMSIEHPNKNIMEAGELLEEAYDALRKARFKAAEDYANEALSLLQSKEEAENQQIFNVDIKDSVIQRSSILSSPFENTIGDCPNCGTNITKEMKFCPNCGIHTLSYLRQLAANEFDRTQDS